MAILQAHKSLPRKYVDLIHASIGKYGNWDPTVAVQLGDYGYVDRATGAFNMQGNIFESNGDFPQRHAAVLATIGEPTIHPADDFMVIKSAGVRQGRTTTSADLSTPADIADLSLKWEFKFGRKLGVALVMLKPTITKFPKEGNLRPLLALIAEELEGKVLVTSIITCDAYGLIVGSGAEESVTIDLASSLPLPSLPFSAGAGAKLAWHHSSTAGTWKAGSEPGCTYTPIIELSAMKRRWSLSHDPVTHRNTLDFTPDRIFQSYLPPWSPLDDAGEEVAARLETRLNLFEGMSYFCALVFPFVWWLGVRTLTEVQIQPY